MGPAIPLRHRLPAPRLPRRPGVGRRAGCPGRDQTRRQPGPFLLDTIATFLLNSGTRKKKFPRRSTPPISSCSTEILKPQSVVFSAGKNANGPLAYLTDWNNHDVRTEGMSYGMMISVELNQKAEFDALWNWAKTYMYIDDPHHPSYGYFSWSCKTDGTPNEETAAPDGEEYFVMALYFAAARWGNGSGNL